MRRAAIDKAKSRLRIAQKAVADIETCKNFDEFSDHWYVFLTATKNIYTVLNKGAQSSPKSKQWMGGKVHERRQDPLLRYIFQARNDDEHGIEPIAEHVRSSLSIGAAKQGFSNSMVISRLSIDNGHVSVGSIKSLDGKPVLVEARSAHIKLVTVRGRENQTYDPPAHHMGRPLPDSSPVTVARLSLAYMSALIEEAEGLAAGGIPTP